MGLQPSLQSGSDVIANWYSNRSTYYQALPAAHKVPKLNTYGCFHGTKELFSAPQRHINPREQSTWSSELSDKREEALRKKALVTFVHLENWVNNFRKSSESDKGMHHTNIKNILLVMIQPKILGPREPNMWMLQDSIDLHQRLKHSH